MNSELELWQFIADRLGRGEHIMLLVVAKSSGSSPGRAGYKMAVAADEELAGSIGGGVMEVNLVEQSRAVLSEPGAVATGSSLSLLIEQVHRRDSRNSSGMICSGRQTVIFKQLDPYDLPTVESVLDAKRDRRPNTLLISSDEFEVRAGSFKVETPDVSFEELGNNAFTFTERLETKDALYIVGGGHCALALSELMSKMDFHILLFDDRPNLNTIHKNRFAHDIKIIDDYDQIGRLILAGANNYVVVMTLGYKSDGIVIRNLLDKDFKYFGVLGSPAKMKTLLRDLESDGFGSEQLARIRAPIGLPINSRTPVEIAVSIAAEIISVRNS